MGKLYVLFTNIFFSGEDVMTIGNNNVFEVDCHVESRKIGDNNIVESKGKVTKHVLVQFL